MYTEYKDYSVINSGIAQSKKNSTSSAIIAIIINKFVPILYYVLKNYLLIPINLSFKLGNVEERAVGLVKKLIGFYWKFASLSLHFSRRTSS